MIVRRYMLANFGDELNTPLVNKISGENVKSVNETFKNPDNDVINMVIGSVLSLADRNTVVWGTGYISAFSRMKEKPLKICAVRGPLTRARLIDQGFECPEVYGDPALLYPRYYKPSSERKFRLGIMPHYIDRDAATLNGLKESDVLFINALDPVNKVVKEVNSCERIASSSLHGLIIADAYGVPSVWIKLSDRVLGWGFKFADYFSSVKRKDRKPLVMNGSANLKSIMDKFEDYEIDINLDMLFEACPFKRQEG